MFGLRGEPEQRVELDRHAGAVGHVVQHQRHHARVGEAREVLGDARLRGPHVVRRRNQQAGERQPAQLLGACQQGRCVVAGEAGDHRHAATGGVQDRRERRGLLGRVERRRLARRAERHEAGDARVRIPLDEAAQGRVVDRTIGRERRHQRHPDAGKIRCHRFHSSTTERWKPSAVRGQEGDQIEGEEKLCCGSVTHPTERRAPVRRAAVFLWIWTRTAPRRSRGNRAWVAAACGPCD